MAKIHMLPPQEAQKIAAGEVVERPASVVKELLENALDANATRITLSIKDGGKKLVRVTDNGCGMSAEDARMCIAKHATSKITCIDDLATIATFGFRGEAMAALAAVSRMTIITKESHTHEATKLTIENGVIVKEEIIAAQTGTTIEIEDLFYNVPARQKFLKKRETEFRQIQQLFYAMSLMHPSVHMQLYSEDVLIAQYAPTHQKERCMQVLTNNTHQTLLSFQESEHDVVVSGELSDHQWFRYDRSHLFLFVNKRWVKNQALTRALMRGYGNVLPSDRFPVAYISIELPTTEVDVNVHPRKEEVQFVHPHRVENMLAAFVKKLFEATLSQRITHSAPFITSQAMYTTMPSSVIAPMQQTVTAQYGTMQQPVMPLPQEFKTGPTIIPAQPTEPFAQPITQKQHTVDALEAQAQIAQEPTYTILGQLLDTYIVVQMDDGLVLVDQHAAHERILYERFANRFVDGATVQLLFPELITLTQSDINTLQPYLEMLADHGIIMESFGQTQLRVVATPVHLKHTIIAELIQYVIGIINEHERMEPEECIRAVQNKLRAQMACKAAVKAGDILDATQMRELLADLYKTENRLTCPHGRPTYWYISQYEIEKKFKRVG